jgi:Secretion system C-terminal sorting domain/SprB repeat
MKTKLISCLFLCVLCFSLQARTKKSNGSKKTINVVWNAHCWDFNPGSYNEANFETAFPDGVSIGHGTKTLSFTSYSEIVNFLNSESYANHLSSDKKLNPDSYNNLLARHLTALTLSIGFDFYDPQYFSNSEKLANFKIRDGFYKDKTVQQFLKIANGIYGDNSQTSSIPNLVSTAKLITQQFSENKFVSLSISSLTLLNDVKCYGGNNGREKVTVNGGVSPFTFTLSNGNVLVSVANSVTFSNLLAGSYTVTVTDFLGNTASGRNAFTISQPSMLMAATSTTDVTCYGLTNGTATVIPSGGTAPYTILWNNGSTSLTLTNLAAGTYTAMLTDANGCCKPITVYVDVPEMLMASASSTNILCYGGYNGSVTATATGGTPAYSILWSNGSTSLSQSGLSAGTYSAVITDANGCTENVSTTISAPSMLVVAASSTNVLCYGESSGTATASASGGTAPYTILWSNGSTSFSQTGLAAGTYTAIISDANLCCKPVSVTIEQPEALMSMIDSTNVLCYGGNTGTATASAMDGTAPYTILWNNGSTDFNLTGLSAGTFTTVITDANGCSENISVTITQPTMLIASASATNVTCYGFSNGTASAVANGGTAPYTILWSNASTNFDLTSLSAGTYTAVVTDANGCTYNVSVDITQPEIISVGTQSSNPTCYGGDNGTITTSPYGGTAPFTILWSNGSTDFNLTGLNAGTYTAVVTDANGCTFSISIEITQPTELALLLTSTDVTCYGGNNGSANVSVSNGTAPYTILWNNGSTSFTNSGLSAGTYTAVVTDANGCYINVIVEVVQPNELTTEFTQYNPTCCMGNSGTTTVTASGGTAPYTILWSNGSTSFSLAGLSSGTLTYVVTDANGCTSNGSVTIVASPLLTASATSTNSSCFASANGTATVIPSGGTAPYTILWSNGSTSFNPNNFTAGTYTAIVTDAMGCMKNITVTIEQPTEFTGTITQVNPNCCAGNNGSATAIGSGGTPVYTVLWSNGATTNTITGLSAGTYTCEMTDANGCTTSGSATIVAPSTISTTSSSNNATCYGSANGSASVTATGGTAPLTILWSNGSTSFNPTNFTAGTYTAVVTDAMGCMKNITVTIEEPLELSGTIALVNPDCTGTNGTATLTVIGGTPIHTVLWSNGATTYTITGLSTGTYTCVLSDAGGCVFNGSVDILAPSAIVATATSTNALCYGGNSGTATASASGGTAPYTILWSNASTDFALTGLSAGTYTAIVTDANGCTANVSVEIFQPTMLMSDVTATNVTCYGGENGTTTASASGGTAPYTILWGNASTAFALTGLSTGTYTAVVTDANGCTASVSVEISQPTLLVSNVTATNATCYGSENGTATASATGGTAPYTILWSNASTAFALTGLSAGTYTAVVTDANGCTANVSVEISQPTLLVSNVTATNANCYGSETGTATASATGGTAPYTILWSNASTDFALTGLSAGTYTAVVTDANGCTANVSVEISQPEMLMTSYESTNVLCYGGENGTATASATGGTAPYTILWSNASTDFALTGLSAGTYTAVVTDANGCTANVSVEISQPTLLVSNVTATNSNCYGSETGTATASATGGTAPYTILWSNASTNFSLTGLSAGTYTAVVTDANGCTANVSVEISQPTLLVSAVSATNVICYGGETGTATVSASGGTAPYTILWSNASTTFALTGLSAGTYTAVVTDANGCTANVSVEISQPEMLMTSYESTNLLCYGDTTGTANVSVSNGTEPYTILWSNASTNFALTGLSAGTYTAVVTDANGCTANVSVVITQPLKLDESIFHTNPDCSGDNGSANANVSGGTAPYTYLWSNGATTASISGLSPGFYTVIITDANGCTETASVVLTTAVAMITSVSNTNVSCFGGNTASATATVTGGAAPHTILWSNGSTSFNPTGLSAGTYTAIISDYYGCKANVSVTITEPEQLVSSYTQNNPSCCGGNNATINVVSSGGTPSHSILWNNGNTNFTRIGLSVGTYTYTVTDYNGCTTSGSVTILNVAPMSILITKTNVTVYGGYGTATASVTGGTAAYTYKWYSSPFQYTQTASLQAGTWKVKVTDANGCFAFKWVTLSQGSCSGYVTVPRGSYGQECTDGGWSCYLTDNFATSFPGGLQVGSNSNLLNFTDANSISGFLPSGNFFGPLGSGTMLNPTSSYNNGLAAQAITLTLTLAFNNNSDFSSPTSSFGDLFVNSGIFAGMTVNQVLDLANRILGGESTNYSASDVYDALNSINNNYENGQVDLGYLVLNNPSLATNTIDLNNQILSYVVYPNPVKDVSKIEFSLTFDSSVNIQVYDLNGRLISELFRGEASSGQKYDVEFNSNDLASGTYFIKLVTDKNVYNKSVMVSK